VALHVVDETDHQLHVSKRAGRTQEQVNHEILAALLKTWMRKTSDTASS